MSIINNLLRKVLFRCKPILYQYYKKGVCENFQINSHESQSSFITDYDYSDKIDLDDPIYKDENWESIKYIHLHMWNDLFPWKYTRQDISLSQENTTIGVSKIIEKNSEIICKSYERDDDWIFLTWERNFKKPYILEFSVKIETINSEFQIAFNYKSIGERYRFNLRNNKTLSFEVINKGFFFNNIESVPFSLDRGRYYNFKILVKQNQFQYIVNDDIIMTIVQKRQIVDGDGIALILWDSKDSNIHVSYKKLQILQINS